MANKKKYYSGDKFVIEIGMVTWSPTQGERYFIKGFDTLVFDNKGLDRLERYQPFLEPKCSDCVYSDIDGCAYPCSMCIRGDERYEMFSPKGSTVR